MYNNVDIAYIPLVLGACAVALATVTSQLATSNILGVDKPHCDINGDYVGIQYRGSVYDTCTRYN